MSITSRWAGLGPVPSDTAFVPRGMLQRACACGQRPSGGQECEECRQKREGTSLRRTAVRSGAVGEAPPSVHKALSQPGQPLGASYRQEMEPRFGYDFSHVRVHAGAHADESARAVEARAYTVGRNVVFAAGEYQPATREGQRLLAHELAHVVQQGGRPHPPPTPLTVGAAGDSWERDAEQVANAVLGDQPVARGPRTGGASPTVQRQPRDPKEDVDPNRNLGPPVQELPLPPRCSFVWKDGIPQWKCEGMPGIGSTGDIPLFPGDIKKKIEDILKGAGGGKGPGGPGPMVPFPGLPGGPGLPGLPGDSGLPPGWLESMCQRNPLLCSQGPQPGTPGQPGASLPSPQLQPGPLWTDTVHFEHDRPGAGPVNAKGSLTADGEKEVESILSWMRLSPTLNVRLLGRASSEGSAEHNLELSKRRARQIQARITAAGFGNRIADPLLGDGQEAGCTALAPGAWACGASSAAAEEVKPEDRRVDVLFWRPLDAVLQTPPQLTPPSLGSGGTP